MILGQQIKNPVIRDEPASKNKGGRNGKKTSKKSNNRVKGRNLFNKNKNSFQLMNNK